MKAPGALPARKEYVGQKQFPWAELLRPRDLLFPVRIVYYTSGNIRMIP